MQDRPGAFVDELVSLLRTVINERRTRSSHARGKTPVSNQRKQTANNGDEDIQMMRGCLHVYTIAVVR